MPQITSIPFTFLFSISQQVDIVSPNGQQQNAAGAGSVDSMASTTTDSSPVLVVQFTLQSGPVRRFKRLVEHLTCILKAIDEEGATRKGSVSPSFCVYSIFNEI
jgi:hypothetical protein